MKLPDLRRRELAAVTPLVLLMVFLGLYPFVLTRVMDALGEGMQLWR